MSDDAPDTDPPTTTPTGTNPAEPPVCALARSCVSTEDDDVYRRIVDPAGPYAEEIRVAHAVSSCMLFAAYLLGWRGHFVADTIQVTLAKLWGPARRIPDVDWFLERGAQVWWQANPATGSDEHVDGCVIAVRRTSLYRAELEVIAGGQRVTGANIAAGVFASDTFGKRCIAPRMRVVVWDSDAWSDSANGRRIRGILDAG